MAETVEIGRLNAATDQTMAYSINRDKSESQQAVDARIGDVAADIIASDPTVSQAAVNAVQEKLDTQGVAYTRNSVPDGTDLDDYRAKEFAGFWTLAFGNEYGHLPTGYLSQSCVLEIATGGTAGASTQTVTMGEQKWFREIQPNLDWSSWTEIVTGTDVQRFTDLGAVRTIVTDHPELSEVRLSHDFRVTGGVLREGGVVDAASGGVAYAVPSGAGVVELTRDFRRALPGAAPNGLLRPEVAAALSQTLSVTAPMTGLTCWGDSMTTDFGGLGVTFARELGRELGIVATDRGFSGETPQQIALRAGVLSVRVTLVGTSTLPVSGAVPVTVDPPTGWFRGRTFPARVADASGKVLSVSLVQAEESSPGTVPTWTLQQVGGVSAATVLPGTRIVGADAADRPVQVQPIIVRFGRNDTDITRGVAALRAFLTQQRDPLRRVLVLPIYNRPTEKRGTPAYAEVEAANTAYAEAAGECWFDLRRHLIDHGLKIAGISPTPEDLAAIADDTPPPSLMLDGTHLNAAGRRVDARLAANEIKTRNW